MAQAPRTADQEFSTKRDWTVLRKNLDARIGQLYTWRWSWYLHWRELAEYMLPRRYQWLITPNKFNKGSPINQRIIDSTATLAARTLAAGLLSGTSSPARQWFNLDVDDPVLADDGDVKTWLADTRDRMLRVMSLSNYYTAKGVQYFDLVIFGTAPMIIYEDPKSGGIRCFNPCAGEYYCVGGKNFNVDGLFREFTMTLAQVVDEFGLENCSSSIQSNFRDGTGQQEREVVIRHAIEPNPEYAPGIATPGPSGVPKIFAYREVYWEAGSAQSGVLRVQGFYDQPFSCPRWDTVSNDAYGRSPAMDALGDVKQLQLEQKRKAQAIDKMVNPPMIADVSMKNEPASLLPGAITYANALNGNVGFRPAFTVTPPIAELKQDILETQNRIKEVFFNDLFMMISNLNTVRSATEIDARKEEKLLMLGPVLERNDTEGLDPDIKRIYGIMSRSGMLAPMPAKLAQARPALKVSYVSALADEQRAATLSGIERMLQLAGNMAAVDPNIMDNIDLDATIDEYASILRVSPKLIRDTQAIQAIRAQKAKAQQGQATMQAGLAAAQGAQVLSNTDVGGGMNALQMMLGPRGGTAP